MMGPENKGKPLVFAPVPRVAGVGRLRQAVVLPRDRAASIGSSRPDASASIACAPSSSPCLTSTFCSSGVGPRCS